MYEQLYSISEESHSFFEGMMIPTTIFIVLLGGAIGILWDRYKKKQYKNMLFTIAFIVFVMFQLCFFVSTSSVGNSQHSRLVEILESSNAKEVVGKIQEFVPRNTQPKVQESFIVNGVKFTYNSSLRTGAYVRGNETLKNGQNVKISYVYDKNWDMNLILKLEIKKEN